MRALVLATALLGCTPGTVTAQELFTGTWSGTYTFGNMSAVLQQNGSGVTGEITDAAGCLWDVSGSAGLQLSLPTWVLLSHPAPPICLGGTVTMMTGTLSSSQTTITGTGETVLTDKSTHPWTFTLTRTGTAVTRIDSIELTQAIQEWQPLASLKASLAASREPPVPIIAGKPAVLRVYGSRPRRTTRVTIEVSSPQVTFTPSSLPFDLQPLCSRDLQRLKDGGARCNSADFYFIPQPGNFDITVLMRGANGAVIESHTLPFRARTTNALKLKAVSVCSGRDTAGVAQDCAPAAALASRVHLLHKIAPTSSVIVEVTNHQPVVERSNYPGNEDDWWEAVAVEVGKLFNLFDLAATGLGIKVKYLGMVLDSPALNRAGWAPIGSEGGASLADTTWGATPVTAGIVAHEVGHLLGLHHTNTDKPKTVGPPGCWEFAASNSSAWPTSWDNTIRSQRRREVGFDVSDVASSVGPVIGRRPIDGKDAFDVMGYCSPAWISPLHYKRLVTALGGGAVTSPLSTEPPAVTGPAWLVSGTIEGDSVRVDPLFAIDGAIVSGTGSHAVQVLNGGGAVLASAAFTPFEVETDEPVVAGSRGFSVIVPRPSGALSLVVRSPTNEILGTLTLGGAAPSVQLVAPTAPGSLVGTTQLTWAITDADSTSHTTRVQYSHDNGVTWSDLGAIETTGMVVDFDKLPGGATTLIRLMVSDSVNSTTSTFGPFSTPKKGSVTAKILSPATDVVVAPGMLFFDGFGLDIDDGSLTGAALAWRSDVAGPLGTGEQIGVALAPGRHAIELRATDRDGNSATATVTVDVAGPAPEVSLTIQSLNSQPTTCVAATIGVTATGLPAAGVEYSLDAGATWSQVPVTWLPFRFIVPGSGSFNMIARAFDAAGQSSAAGELFSTSGTCATVAPGAWSAPAGGGTQAVDVSSSVANLAWTAFSDRPWLTVSPASGTGPGTVTLTAAATTSVAVRTATAWIAGQPVAVTQAGGTPSFVVTPATWHAPNAGGSRQITVTATLSDAPWTASSSETWLTVSPSSGAGSGTVTLTAAANAGETRTAAATIAGHTVTVSQGRDIPSDLRVTRVDGNLVTLRWSWSGPATSGFVVAGGLHPGQTLATLPTGSDYPIYTFIAPTGSFFVRVHAAEDTAFERPSNEVPLIVNVPVAPSAPANLLGTISGNRVDLAWTNTFGGGAPAGVTLQVSGSVTTAFPLGPTERFSFVGVPPGTYTLAVVASNAGGVSDPSNAVTLTFPTGCTGAPLTPTQFLAYRIGRTVFVVWEPAETGPAPTDYALNVAELGLSLPTGGARMLSGTVLPGSYTVAVSASNLCGASAPTAAQTVVVP
jgi:hypothetical protein